MKRVITGISGLDSLVGGGFPQKSLVLLSGTSGTGKTVFGLQFLFNAAKDEPGIFFSFEDDVEKIKEIAGNFGWDAEKYEQEGKVRFLRYDPFRLEDIIEIIENNIREIGAKKVVIDSISAIGLYVRDPPELRRMVMQISNILRKNSCTALLTSEIISGKEAVSRFGVEEFVVDGVIVLHTSLVGGEYKRALSVRKMIATDHSMKVHPYRISSEGFMVYPKEVFKGQ